MNSFLLELAYSVRRLRVAPQFSLVTIGTLALGIGAACSIFSAVTAVLIRPLPVPDPERLYLISETFENYHGTVAYPNYLDWKSRNKVFSEMGVGYVAGVNLMDSSGPVRLRAAMFSASMLPLLGAQAWRGRAYNERDEQGDVPHALMLTYSSWTARFHSDPSVVGRETRLDGAPATIIGILSPEFRFVADNTVEALVPLVVPPYIRDSRGMHALLCVARTKPGVDVEAATKDLTRVAADLAHLYPDTNTGRGVLLESVPKLLTERLRPILSVLLGAVLCLLAIACVNVANLMLSRATVRRREFSVRLALGAGRWTLAWQFFAEGLILAAISGALGLVLGRLGLEALILLAPSVEYARKSLLDPFVVAFALGATLLSAILPSLAPFWQILRSDPNEFLKEGARSTPDRGANRLRNVLVVAETAGACVLLTGAVLLMNSFVRLTQVETGLELRGVLTAAISVPDPKNDGVPPILFFRALLTRLRAESSVRSVGVVSMLPVRDAYTNMSFYIDGLLLHDKLRVIENRIVAGDYFQTVGIRLLRGRFFQPSDDEKGQRVVILNNAAVATYFPHGMEALGHIVRFDDAAGADGYRVVGIVADYKNYGLKSNTFPEMYRPHSVAGFSDMHVVLRGNGTPEELEKVLRKAAQAVDPSLPIYDVAPLLSTVYETLNTQRFQTVLLGVFAFSSLLLSAIGIYAVMTYVVGQRTREIGIRMALGASHEKTFRQTTGAALRLTGYGLAIGLAAAALLSRTLAGSLFKVPPIDPLSYFAAAFLLGGVAFAAAAGPARWASRVDPAIALRQDGTGLLLLPPRSEAAPVPAARPANAAALENALVTGVARSARQSNGWAQLFENVCEFVRETCQVESVALLAADGDNRFATPDGSVSLPASAFVLRRLRGFDGVLPIAADDFNAWEHALASNPDAWEERRHEIAVLRRVNARFLVPLRSGAELTGVLVLGPARGATPPSAPLLVLGGQLGLLLENARLSRRAAEAEALERELRLAADVQQRLLPAKPPEVPGVRIAGLCRPAQGVGGDYFDYFVLPSGRLAVVVADVAGKGMGAALVVSLLYSALRTLAPAAGGNIAAMVGELNRLLQRATQPRAFATMFYAEFDPATRTLTYCNAGHLPPVRRAADRTVHTLPGSDKVVGMFARMTYTSHQVTLEPGDRIVIFSDGVTEALNEAGDEFGDERLVEAVVSAPPEEATAARRIVLAVQAWAGAREPFDDVTVVVLDVPVP